MEIFNKQPDFDLVINRYRDCMKRIPYNNMGELPLFDNFIEKKDKMNMYLFFLAISMVGYDYIIYNEDKLNRKLNPTKRKKIKIKYNKYLERTFSYELYRHWQNLIQITEEQLRVDAEIGKKITYQDIKSTKLSMLKGKYKMPDLVLHASQGSTDDQLLVCEIKRDEQLSKDKVKEDIVKICHFMDPKIWNNHPYKYGCFVLASRERSFDDFMRIIRLCKRDLASYSPKVNFNSILCVLYNGDFVAYESLNNIFSI